LEKQIQERENLKDTFKKSYPDRAMEILNIDNKIKSLESIEKQYKMKNQEEYSKILASQIRQKEEVTSKIGLMPEMERKLHKSILNNNDNKINAIIPGLNHIESVGSKPLCRWAKNNILPNQNMIYSSFKSNLLTPEPNLDSIFLM